MGDKGCALSPSLINRGHKMKPISEKYYKELAKKIYWKSGKPYWKSNYFKSKCNTLAGTLCRGYRVVHIAKKFISAHRLRWYMEYGYVPKELDHVDQDKDNNAISNLRIATSSQNNMNKSKSGTGFNKYIGVGRGARKWQATITVRGRRIYIGSFDTEEEAALARDKKAKELHGEFAVLNF